MGRAVLALTLSGAPAVSLSVRSGQTAVPLAVTISRLQMVAPRRVGFEVTIAGLRSELTPTIDEGWGENRARRRTGGTTLAGTAWDRMKVSSVIPSSIGGSRSA